MENIKLQLQNIDKQIDGLFIQMPNNPLLNCRYQIYNLSSQLLNIVIQMINFGNQFPITGMDFLNLQQQIQNYIMQIQNLTSPINIMNNMGIQMNNNMNQIFNSNNNFQNNMTLIQNEFKSCIEDPYLIHAGSKFELENNDLYTWRVTLQGPLGTPYKEGFFAIKINIPKDYPSHGPSFSFLTKIYHLNVDYKNDIGHISYPRLNEFHVTGKVKGKLYNIKNCIYDILAFFYEPLVDCPYSEKMALQYQEKRDEFDKEARKWTKEYASNPPASFVKRGDYPF